MDELRPLAARIATTKGSGRKASNHGRMFPYGGCGRATHLDYAALYACMEPRDDAHRWKEPSATEDCRYADASAAGHAASREASSSLGQSSRPHADVRMSCSRPPRTPMPLSSPHSIGWTLTQLQGSRPAFASSRPTRWESSTSISTRRAGAALQCCRRPMYSATSVAEMAILLMLGAARRAHEGHNLLYGRAWKGWTPTQLVGVEVTGRRIGIVGMGRIGRTIARRARGFDMTVHYHNRRPPRACPRGGRLLPRHRRSLLAAKRRPGAGCAVDANRRRALLNPRKPRADARGRHRREHRARRSRRRRTR